MLQTLIRVIESEAAILKFALFFWAIKKSKTDTDTIFTNSIASGDGQVFNVILFLSLFEIFLTYLVVGKIFHGNAMLAVSIAGDLTFLYVFGIARSISRMPTVLSGGRLHIRFGVLKRLDLDLHQIASLCEIDRGCYEKDRARWKGTLIEIPNIRARLKTPVRAGLLGRKTVSEADFWIDRPEHFLSVMQAAGVPRCT